MNHHPPWNRGLLSTDWPADQNYRRPPGADGSLQLSVWYMLLFCGWFRFNGQLCHFHFCIEVGQAVFRNVVEEIFHFAGRNGHIAGNVALHLIRQEYVAYVHGILLSFPERSCRRILPSCLWNRTAIHSSANAFPVRTSPVRRSPLHCLFQPG